MNAFWEEQQLQIAVCGHNGDLLFMFCDFVQTPLLM